MSNEENIENQKVNSRPAFMQLILPISILVAAVLISGAVIYNKKGMEPKKNQAGSAQIGEQLPQKVDLKVFQNDHVLGNTDAKVLVIEYSDFQCPFCRKFWQESFEQLKKEFIDSGKVKYIYRHYPLDFHPGAIPAAKAVECANESGNFWVLHDKIFQEQAKQGQGTIQFTEIDIKKWAAQIGLSEVAFSQCLSSEKYSGRVNEDLISGNEAGVRGTPTAFVNGQRIVGAQPYSAFKAAIEEALK